MGRPRPAARLDRIVSSVAAPYYYSVNRHMLLKPEKETVMTVRAKFTCTSVTKSQNWNKSEAHPFLYAYKFQVVTGNSDENKAFFASTPSGSIDLQAVRDDLFEPGKSYYLDFTPAE